MKRVLYLGWIGHNNLGDELLWNLFNRLSNLYFGQEEIEIIPSLKRKDLDLNKYDSIVLGGGSVLLPKYIHLLHKGIQQEKKVLIWGSGLDWIKKNDLDLMISNGKPLLHEPINKEYADILKEIFARASFAGVRGPLTKKALEFLGVSGDHIRIIGDPGMLLKQNNASKTKESEKRIGLNWGTSHNKIYGNNETKVEDGLVEVSKNLIKRGYKILIYGVWTNDLEPCQRLFDKINDSSNVILDKTLYEEQQLITVLSSCTLTINFKLHANLLSLAANVPSVLLGYRFKIFDLAYLLGLEKYIVSTNSSDLETEILKRVHLIEQNHSDIIKDYKERQKAFNPLMIEPFNRGLIT
ncbi:polysaccharide pyruvyl transferase family protein [Bacillus songklensis]|uniref:Polysaccharide pyruvyl transferase family protein n=1 Tax=Bacillus songklensis TaxID=1069116 RepID=A0ABV8B4F8_9BACI